MLNYLKEESNITHTENGAATYRTTYSSCLDLFSHIGALRSADDEAVISAFIKAYAENPDMAMRVLFFARDIREGLGERRVFRVILRWLAHSCPASVNKNVGLIAEYGRFDDLICLLGTPCENAAVSLISRQLDEDIRAAAGGKEISLLAKWLPSVNASSCATVKTASYLARHLHMTSAEYRKTLSSLRSHIKIIENNLRTRDYSFDYSKQPSKALYKYRKAFLRNDCDRYSEFLSKAAAGECTIHTASLTPYDIIAPVFSKDLSEDERHIMDVTWNALDDFTDGENSIAVVDGSGSMYCGGEPLPAAVAMSLGVYFAERNTGSFRNHFITFSRNPQLVEIKGNDITAKIEYCMAYNEVANTNIQRVFELILDTAVKHNIPPCELPAKVYIISDMEFDYCTDDAEITNFEYAKRIFSEHGYSLPQIVFWSVSSRHAHQPVTKNDQGAILVSGPAARIFSMMQTGSLNPYEFMLSVLAGERYAGICA
ncbi:MAG: DUF2828 family protein [Eubacteriaceae bacterium]|jgi:hypothetical protein|nr:DUF2828 family protein [Eubacteriaceae bacterium]